MPIFDNIALEEDASGQTQVEKERVFYAQIENASVLKRATGSEQQEQWQVRLPKNDQGVEARVRVRKTVYADGRVEYVQTIKVPMAGNQVGHSQMNETSVPVTEDVFEQFKLFASDGMVKTRYFFDSRGKTLEVDVFPTKTGEIANWCKIDYEYGPDEPSKPDEFPLGFINVIPGDTPDEKDKAFIRQLYAEVFSPKRG